MVHGIIIAAVLIAAAYERVISRVSGYAGTKMAATPPPQKICN
jgi:hypothetical protein